MCCLWPAFIGKSLQSRKSFKVYSLLHNMVHFDKEKGEENYEEAPIWETLEKDQCMIIARGENHLLTACNKDGDIKVKKIRIPEEFSD